jgi:PAS domain S-box-containing protein
MGLACLMHKPEPIRLLLAEDNPADVELEVRELRNAGIRVAHRVADTEESFIRELTEFAPDVIVSDFSMPRFDGQAALRIARVRAPGTPFLFVSGTLGEENAIRALKKGAADYVLKDNLIRLPTAVLRALDDADARRARLNAQASLERAQRMAKLAHLSGGPGGAFVSWSESLATLLGGEDTDVPRSLREWLDLVHPDDRVEVRRRSLEATALGNIVDMEYRLHRKDGEWIRLRQLIEPLSIRAEPGKGGKWFSTLQDVTGRKRAEH